MTTICTVRRDWSRPARRPWILRSTRYMGSVERADVRRRRARAAAIACALVLSLAFGLGFGRAYELEGAIARARIEGAR